jgi:hypothetical protein
MGADHCSANRQAHALATALGGEKRIENLCEFFAFFFAVERWRSTLVPR